MIDVPNSVFPLNIVELIMSEMEAKLDLVSPPVMRPLRVTDANGSIGIFPVNWEPSENSHQIGGHEATIQKYAFRIHNLVKHTNAEEGRIQYAADSKKLRIMLATSADLRLALAQLRETDPDRTERFLKLTIGRQNFLNNELQGNFLFLASTELVVETQVDNLGGM